MALRIQHATLLPRTSRMGRKATGIHLWSNTRFNQMQMRVSSVGTTFVPTEEKCQHAIKPLNETQKSHTDARIDSLTSPQSITTGQGKHLIGYRIAPANVSDHKGLLWDIENLVQI